VTELIWSFMPWLLFLLATRITSFSGAVAVGMVAALVVTGRAIERHRLHVLEVASVVYFLGLGIVLGVVHPGHLDYWSRYAQAGSHAFLTVIVFGSILVGHPFTESYARETTPKEVWDTPEFHSINRTISAVWGLAFLVGTVSLLVAGSVTERQFLLRVLVPFGTLAWAYTYTQRVTGRVESDKPLP
jgi:hypothetical protein